jgi:hypothetical protein
MAAKGPSSALRAPYSHLPRGKREKAAITKLGACFISLRLFREAEWEKVPTGG